MRKGHKTRERILDTALELFWRRSFHAVNHAFGEFSAFYRQIVVDLNGPRKRRPFDLEATVEALLQLMNAGMIALKLRNHPDDIIRAHRIAERFLAF